MEHFALVHTKLRNRLSYDKLHKLVSVHYNLKLRIQQYEDDIHSLQDMQIQHEMDSDPYSMLMDAAVFDDRNPIMDWLVNSRSLLLFLMKMLMVRVNSLVDLS